MVLGNFVYRGVAAIVGWWCWVYTHPAVGSSSRFAAFSGLTSWRAPKHLKYHQPTMAATTRYQKLPSTMKVLGDVHMSLSKPVYAICVLNITGRPIRAAPALTTFSAH